jgi:hypothetical protein
MESPWKSDPAIKITKAAEHDVRMLCGFCVGIMRGCVLYLNES